MNECFPYLARRLLTEDSERMHKMLRTFLYGKDGRYLKVTGLDGQHETTEKKRKNLGSIFVGVCRWFFSARSCSSVRLGHGVPAGWEVCMHHGRSFAVSWSERVDCLVLCCSAYAMPDSLDHATARGDLVRPVAGASVSRPVCLRLSSSRANFFFLCAVFSLFSFLG